MANGDLLTEYYPVTPYNFDVAPNPYLIGPLKSILQTVEARLIQLYADIANVQAQVTVQSATGVYLDAHGVLYSTPRLAGEPDDAYRPRILEAITKGKLTIAAIQAVVTNFLVSSTNQDGGGIAPTGHVYDLTSDPTECAVDAANGNPIQLGDIVIEIDRTISENDIFFLDYSYLDGTTYLFQAGTTYDNESQINPELQLIIDETRAAGTNVVYKNTVTVGA